MQQEVRPGNARTSLVGLGRLCGRPELAFRVGGFHTRENLEDIYLYPRSGPKKKKHDRSRGLLLRRSIFASLEFPLALSTLLVHDQKYCAGKRAAERPTRIRISHLKSSGKRVAEVKESRLKSSLDRPRIRISHPTLFQKFNKGEVRRVAKQTPRRRRRVRTARARERAR